MELYWWLRLAQLHEIGAVFLFAIGIGIVIVMIGNLIALSDRDDSARISLKKCLKTLGFLLIPCVLICFLCPDRKDLAIMFGWDALHSKTAQEVLEKVKERLLP